MYPRIGYPSGFHRWKTYRTIRCSRCGASISSNGLAQASHRHSRQCDRRWAYNLMYPNGWNYIQGNNLRGLPHYLQPRVGGLRWAPRDLLRIFEQLSEWFPTKDIYEMLREPPEILDYWKTWAAKHTPEGIDL